MPDSFNIHDVERILRAEGWIDEDFLLLTAGGMPKNALRYIKQEHAYEVAMSSAEALGTKPLEEVFTPELTKQLGFQEGYHARFLRAMRNYRAYEGVGAARRSVHSPITVIKELLTLGRKKLLSEQHISTGTVRYVEAVLKTIGITLPDF